MIPIKKPDINVDLVFTDCISKVRNPNLKTSLLGCKKQLVDNEVLYDSYFPLAEIYKFQSDQSVLLNKKGEEEMVKVYNDRMAKNGSPGRSHYNTIRSSAPHSICPLCSIRGVDTLDHYLPESKFPVLAVTPINLIPSCTPCNKGKLVSYPKSKTDQTLNPYYDNSVNKENWIKASIIQSDPIAFNFYADPPKNWDETLRQRTISHFLAFKLNEVFSSYTNTMFRGAVNQLKNQFKISPKALKDHLEEGYKSNLNLGPNSYQAILYYTLLNDDWFCNTGILQD